VAAGGPAAAHALRGQRRLIFVTVGTHHQPFQRLLDALGSLQPAELVVQYGSGKEPADVARAVPFMGFAEMLDHFERAEHVVTHAGVGSILCARRCGHVPVVVPRERRYGEHVDDHQVELTRALENRGSVVALRDLERLSTAIEQLPPRGSVTAGGNGALPWAVREAIK
jgi:UDP-N-acetylglucosamine transferase subunit ALG13